MFLQVTASTKLKPITKALARNENSRWNVGSVLYRTCTDFLYKHRESQHTLNYSELRLFVLGSSTALGSGGRQLPYALARVSGDGFHCSNTKEFKGDA
jgi:hypothetical protein